jgi:glycosyltransferase involved in cell wall biosynthesis
MISVIVPVFNGGKYLARALESILAQDHRPIEIVVVDDGSTDHTTPAQES